MEFTPGQRVHFMGVGGISMSALAETLAVQGLQVSGCDRGDSPRLEGLRAKGVEVLIGHDPAHLAGVDAVVRTTAIRDDNPELQAAVAAGLPILHRSQVLASMLRGKRAVAVAGTHGKTTTSAMLALILEAAGLDPTAFIGGDVLQWGSNHRAGRAPLVVLEADESDGSFREYPGCSEVISCIEFDHGDQHGTIERLEEVFAGFMAQADPEGFLVWGADCPRLQRLVAACPARKISFGLNAPADYSATDLTYDGMTVRATVRKAGVPAGELRLQVPGEHNLRNALAALAAAEACGVPLATALASLAEFRSTGRRFELLGKTDRLAVVDDYAHHPTEVRVTLAAARLQPYERIVAVFQPHLYSRTQFLMEEFAAAFRDADVVILAEIYAAREEPIPGVSSAVLAEAVGRCEPGKPVYYAATREAARELVLELARPGDLILTIGAGDIRLTGEELAKHLCNA